MKVYALVVAAGMSSRMGEFKPMLPIGEISAAQRVLSTLQQAGAQSVVVVTGNQAEKLEHHLARSGAIFLRNPDYAQTDMFRSVCIGLSFLRGKCERLLFTPVDVPLFTAGTARRLLESGADIACPLHDGEEGHPMMLNMAAGVADKLLAYRGGEGLRGAVIEAGLAKELVVVEDAGVRFDMDTPQDYARLLSYHNEQLLRPVLSLHLAREGLFFGPEAARFLSLIGETGSVRAACGCCGISYSKAWALLSDIERSYGETVVEKRRGGSRGGASRLTAAGGDLLRRYEACLLECQKEAERIFGKHFSVGDAKKE